MLICFEGMDGVGKTSVARNVSEVLNIKIIDKPIKKLLNLSSESSKEITNKLYDRYSSKIHAMYYLMGYLSAFEDSRRQNVILDRGFLSTFYFTYNDENSDVFDYVASSRPDLTIILYASVDKRIERIMNRNSNDRDLKKSRVRDGYEKYFECVEKYTFPHLVVNTDNLTVEEVSKLCCLITDCFVNNPKVLKNLEQIFSAQNINQMGNNSFDELIELVKKAKLIEMSKK